MGFLPKVPPTKNGKKEVISVVGGGAIQGSVFFTPKMVAFFFGFGKWDPENFRVFPGW